MCGKKNQNPLEVKLLLAVPLQPKHSSRHHMTKHFRLSFHPQPKKNMDFLDEFDDDDVEYATRIVTTRIRRRLNVKAKRICSTHGRVTIHRKPQI